MHRVSTFALLLGIQVAWSAQVLACPQVIVSDTADNSDGRISKVLSCPSNCGNIVAGNCRSSSPAHSGPLVRNEQQGKSTWYCEWQTRVPEGVSLRIQVTCDPA